MVFSSGTHLSVQKFLEDTCPCKRFSERAWGRVLDTLFNSRLRSPASHPQRGLSPWSVSVHFSLTSTTCLPSATEVPPHPLSSSTSLIYAFDLPIPVLFLSVQFEKAFFGDRTSSHPTSLPASEISMTCHLGPFPSSPHCRVLASASLPRSCIPNFH